MSWTYEDIPDQSGREAIVTGANTGTGYQAARALLTRGAHVVLACRNPERARTALAKLGAEKLPGTAMFEDLDLASLTSVRDFADRMRQRGRPIDLLVNNAGVMVPPEARTADGFELQIGVNHLGHFALTGLLLETMRNSASTRIVTVSSIAHREGRIDVGSFRGEKAYRAFREYRQSKLANLIFALELDRRLSASRFALVSMAAHPGVTRTELPRHRYLFGLATRLVGTPPPQGALPIVRAATDPSAGRGEYYGPDGFMEMWGSPARARVDARAHDRDVASRLWQVSEELTGVRFPF
jgi:NAD(P)-dependent dehydrogenase (short-subunit alcohol dehydrogenase family)